VCFDVDQNCVAFETKILYVRLEFFTSSGMLRRVALVRTGVEERIASIIKMRRIGELGTTLAVTSNRSTLRWNIK
jgi:hypothetical protein